MQPARYVHVDLKGQSKQQTLSVRNPVQQVAGVGSLGRALPKFRVNPQSATQLTSIRQDVPKSIPTPVNARIQKKLSGNMYLKARNQYTSGDSEQVNMLKGIADNNKVA